MSEGRRIRRRFGHRFGGWLAVVALFTQIVVAAVHRPALVDFASPAMTLAGFIALFGDQASLCQSLGAGAAPSQPAKSDHGAPTDPLMAPCPICTTLLQIVATLPPADIVVFPTPLASALMRRAPPDHVVVLRQTTDHARPRAPPPLA